MLPCAFRLIWVWPGSEISICHFLEGLLGFGQICDRPNEAGDQSFEFLETLGLVGPGALLLLAPVVKSLLGDAQPLDHLGDGLALA